jgi:regulator of sirC expression with transglutaminase-like and TPR domain
MNSEEIKALISLLDDPDEQVYSEIKTKLISFGTVVIPTLEDSWTYTEQIVQNRIETIVHQIYFNQLINDFKDWLKDKEYNLLQGAILIARYQYPELNGEKVKNYIDQIRRDAWLEMGYNLTALEKVRIINHVLYNVYGFNGDTTNVYSVQNAYINNVIETKKGNPISLSVVYAIIAQNLDIPIYGINLPEHFILAYSDKASLLPFFRHSDNHGVLFYINPFSKGSVFSKNEIDAFLHQLNIKPEKAYYSPCNNLTIIKRMLHNLIKIYESMKKPENIEELKKLLGVLNGEE